MADESILTYKRPSYPVEEYTTKGYRTVIEYIGPTATIEAAVPDRNSAWGNYSGYVESVRLEPVENTGYSVLTVTLEYSFSDSGGSPGQSQGTIVEVKYELEWVMFQRSMFEHPAFTAGGVYELSASDISAINKWKNNDNATQKAAFKYKDTEEASTFTALGANAVVFAKGLNLGLENYEDYAPVIRKTTTYADGMPGQSEAGLKNNPPSFLGGPPGYQWRKTADRAIQSDIETRWDRVEEWTGAVKVLFDKENIYWV